VSNRVNGGLRARPIERFGWVPDLPDARDFMFSTPEAILTKMPTKVDLTAKMPPIYDQGQLGSCTANAIGAAFEFDQVKEGYKDFMPSRLFIYYNERAMEGTIDTDSGAMIRDGMKSVAKVGVCAEDTWAYDISKFTEKPPTKAYSEAKKHQAPLELIQYVHENGKLPVPNFSAGGIATPADAALMMQLGVDGVFVGSGIFKSGDPARRAKAIVEATTHFTDAKIIAEVSKGLGEAMVGIGVTQLAEGERLAVRGW